jgi:hypothetical protein
MRKILISYKIYIIYGWICAGYVRVFPKIAEVNKLSDEDLSKLRK